MGSQRTVSCRFLNPPCRIPAAEGHLRMCSCKTQRFHPCKRTLLDMGYILLYHQLIPPDRCRRKQSHHRIACCTHVPHPSYNSCLLGTCRMWLYPWMTQPDIFLPRFCLPNTSFDTQSQLRTRTQIFRNTTPQGTLSTQLYQKKIRARKILQECSPHRSP